MADLSQTPASVLPSDLNLAKRGVSGEAVLAGAPIYKAADGSLKNADANGTAPAPTVVGIAVTSAPGVGQPLLYIDEDPNFNPGATTVVGTIYVVSATAGKLAPAADLVTGMTVDVVGVGMASNKMALKIIATGQVVP